MRYFVLLIITAVNLTVTADFCQQVQATDGKPAAPLQIVGRDSLPETLAGKALCAAACPVREQLEPHLPELDRRYCLRHRPTATGPGSAPPPGVRLRLGRRRRGRARIQGSGLFLPLLPQARRRVADRVSPASGACLTDKYQSEPESCNSSRAVLLGCLSTS